jgi:GDPmannose 4,6-dehydratase
MRKAIVTGLTGQDGSYLAENLLAKGYEVYGLVRRVSTPNYTNIQHLFEDTNFHIEEGDITDLSSLIRIFKKVQPDEIYNLAAQSYVAISWDQPQLTCNVTGIGALNIFEAARQVCKEAKIYQASSSEMYDGITSHKQKLLLLDLEALME